MISVTLPSSWRTFVDGKQTVSHGPGDEEVIISRSTVEGSGSDTERERAISSLRSAVLESMRRSASDAELDSPTVHEDVTLANGVVVSHISSVSRSLAIQFDQFALSHGCEVLFVTYEAPISASASLRLIEEAVQNACVNQRA